MSIKESVMERKYLDENVWVIEDFISDSECETILACLKDKTEREMNDGGWTMRSHARGAKANMWNRWLNANNSTYDDNESQAVRLLSDTIMTKIEEEFKDYGVYKKTYTFTRYDIPAVDENGVIINPYNSNLTLEWHFEGAPHWSPKEQKDIMSTGLVLVLNDDYEGGDLVFKYNNIRIKSKKGMLINVPVEKEYTHGLEDLTSGSRFILYGHVWKKVELAPFSEDC